MKKFALSLITVISVSSSAFAYDVNIATMFTCTTEADADGLYYNAAVETRGFETVKVSLSVEDENGDPNKINPDLLSEDGIVGTKVSTRVTYSNRKNAQGYGFKSAKFGEGRIYLIAEDYAAFTADTTGKTHGESKGVLTVDKEDFDLKCKF